MEPHFEPPPGPQAETAFPVLPILTPAEEQQDRGRRRSSRDKYGGILYLGIAGLMILAALVGWFAWNAWSLRTVWRNFYVLHDQHRSDVERVEAAFVLSRDPRVNQRQYWDTCLRRPLPALARYLLAESLTAEAVTADPRGYALAVARSTDWPVWLRLLLARPLAYAAAQGMPVPVAALRELRDKPYDPAIRLWAEFALAASRPPDDDGALALARTAESAVPERSFARLLREALALDGPDRISRLDEATRWLRTHHPEAARVWAGWKQDGDRLVRVH
jgi:hypothetical protein